VSGTGSAYAGAVDYECFEVFNQPFSLAQHLYGMPSGLYVLEAQAFYRNGGQAEHKAAIESGTAVSNAQLFIENADGEKTFAPIAFISDCFVSDISSANVGDTWYQYDSGKYVADRMVSAAYVFDTAQLYQPTESSNTVSMTFTAAEGATLGIGAYKSALSANDWTILAGFRLIYKGNPEPAVPTGIKCLDSTSRFPADVFSANGQLIRRQASSLDALPHGIYLVNGKKLMK